VKTTYKLKQTAKKIQNTEQNTTYYVHNYMRKERRKKKNTTKKTKYLLVFLYKLIFLMIKFSGKKHTPTL